MTTMNGKKDPGKFTVRFNEADPQQKMVIDLLNKQGRYKAQFLVNAILHYIHCPETPDIYAGTMKGTTSIEDIVKNVLAQQQMEAAGEPLQVVPESTEVPPKPTDWPMERESQFDESDRDAIFQTLSAFYPK